MWPRCLTPSRTHRSEMLDRIAYDFFKQHGEATDWGTLVCIKEIGGEGAR